jgi:hypothetical protein
MAMSGKAFLAVFVVIFVSLLVLTQAVEVSKANWIYLPQAPIIETPALTVQSPTSNATYADNVVLRIAVTKPLSWYSEDYSPQTVGGISYIHFKIDGVESVLFQTQFFNPVPNDNLETTSSFAAALNGLSNGTHTLEVIVYSQALYGPNRIQLPNGPVVTGEPTLLYNTTVFENETFTVISSTMPSPSPSPSSVMPATPLASPTPTSSPSVPEFQAGVLIPILLTILLFVVTVRKKWLELSM